MTNNLPDTMLAKIRAEECPTPGITGMCWAWTGCLNSRGYGCVGINKKVYLTHRVSYELHIGEIPAGLQIDHLCRNKRCCNPHHLEAVTGKINCERTAAAQKTRCTNGHPLAGPNVRMKKKPSGLTQRQCRACELDASFRQTERNRTAGRGTYKSSALRRDAKREWLIAAGEAALAGEPIPTQDEYAAHARRTS